MAQGYIEKGFNATEDDYSKINQFTRSEFNSDSLYVFSVVLCSNDIDRDYEKFSVDALGELAEAFIGKTGISDHSMKSSDQKARIFDTWVEKVEGRKTTDGEDYYQLKAKAYMVKSDENMPLITEIEAGIKKEVSVSCSMGKNICSICKEDKKAGKCRHINGKSYDGKTAYSVLSQANDAYEFSFVAVPAQREAGVTKAFTLKKEDLNMENIMTTLKSCDGELVLSRAQCNAVVNELERLEEEADLGREYKKNLASEVVRLCTVAMPDMDIKAFSSVAQVMTVSELNAFKKAFSKANYSNSARLQFKGSEQNNTTFEQFKI